VASVVIADKDQIPRPRIVACDRETDRSEFWDSCGADTYSLAALKRRHWHCLSTGTVRARVNPKL
jgi:hypothetical protein